MEQPIWPHILQCNSTRTAKYIRLSVRGYKPLYLKEVKVTGTFEGERFLLLYPSAFLQHKFALLQHKIQIN